MKYTTVSMRVTISKEDIRFTVFLGRKVMWAREIAIQPPNSETYQKVEEEMKHFAWLRAHS